MQFNRNLVEEKKIFWIGKYIDNRWWKWKYIFTHTHTHRSVTFIYSPINKCQTRNKSNDKQKWHEIVRFRFRVHDKDDDYLFISFHDNFLFCFFLIFHFQDTYEHKRIWNENKSKWAAAEQSSNWRNWRNSFCKLICFVFPELMTMMIKWKNVRWMNVSKRKRQNNRLRL